MVGRRTMEQVHLPEQWNGKSLVKAILKSTLRSLLRRTANNPMLNLQRFLQLLVPFAALRLSFDISRWKQSEVPVSRGWQNVSVKKWRDEILLSTNLFFSCILIQDWSFYNCSSRSICGFRPYLHHWARKDSWCGEILPSHWPVFDSGRPVFRRHKDYLREIFYCENTLSLSGYCSLRVTPLIPTFSELSML